MADLFARYAPENEALLRRRDALQAQIDSRYRRGGACDGAAQRAFLTEIGYLVPEPAPFTIAPKDVDEEVALRAGPQLSCRCSTHVFCCNAANARWGSLYDALYGSDAIAAQSGIGGYDPSVVRP